MEETVRQKYNPGIDFLRILAMLMICTLHVICHGGLRTAVPANSIKSIVISALIAMCLCCVNIFGLISGYVGIFARHPWRNGVNLWLNVLFYSIGIMLLFAIFMPSKMLHIDCKTAFLPVSRGNWWYFSEYMKLVLIIPILNYVLNNMSEHELKRLLWTFTVFCVFMSIVPLIGFVPDCIVQKGFSCIWLSYLYLLGGFSRKYGFRHLLPKTIEKTIPGVQLQNSKIVFLYGLSVLITILAGGTFRWLENKWGGYWHELKSSSLAYSSPFVLLSAVLLFRYGIRLQLGNTLQRIIKIISPSVFFVYIIHMHPMVYQHILCGSTICYADMKLFGMVASALLCSVGLFAVSILLDVPRRFLLCILSKRL